jgi:peptide/nickel transport system permease protein
MSLMRYFAAKFVTYLLVLYIGITITFFLPRFMPGDPIDAYLGQITTQAGQTMSPQAIENLRHSLAKLYGLEGSLPSQYVAYMKRVFLTQDFGPSLSAFPRPVTEFIATALPWTLGLLGTATLISWTLGNLIGLLAGYFHNNHIATALEVVGVIIYPIPYYIIALVLLLLFGYVWLMFPLSTTIRPGPLTIEKIQSIFRNSFLPALTLVLAGFGWNILGMKALAYATKEENFVTYARLKGVPSRTIMVNYVFRNAILPQVTALALSIGMIFNGALLTEILFSYPGLGLLMRTAVGAGDYNMLYGTITMSIVAVATAAFVIDLLYPLIDPRIRYR